MAGLSDLRRAIGEALAAEKAYNLPNVCLGYGLDGGTEEEANRSKRYYVINRLQQKPLDFLVGLAQKILVEHDDPRLRKVLSRFTSSGVAGQAKNLIFATNGPKPEIVLSDAVNNDIQIVRNAEFCLVFDEPFPVEGLKWNFLLSWWAKKHGTPVSRELALSLYRRLKISLASKPEQIFFESFYRWAHKTFGDDFPALIPQVYLHYDPLTFKQLNGQKRLTHQRMDFLMLFPRNIRIVIEIDGIQHYSENNLPSATLYAQMVAADRSLTLAGYEIHRFGGAEFCGAKGLVNSVIISFFSQLMKRHGISG